LGVNDPYDPQANIMGGTRYLKKLLNRYDGDVSLALAAYNWGMGNLENHRNWMPQETRNYVSRITSLYNRNDQGAS
jgi:soluble lytic murein transglycosylase-like protein